MVRFERRTLCEVYFEEIRGEGSTGGRVWVEVGGLVRHSTDNSLSVSFYPSRRQQW